MGSAEEEILERIRIHCDNGLRYYASALNRLRSGEWVPSRNAAEEEEHSITNAIYSLANILALIEGATEPHSMMTAREEIFDRYLKLTLVEPWVPPQELPER
jgi:hypothetical protein